MSDLPEFGAGQADVGDLVSALGGAVVDAITGLPAPVRKNAETAFTRLCTSAVEYPLALIEGAVATKKAETRARVKLIDASANQIAEQMRIDPQYIRSAATKFANKIVRERVNIDQISQIAAEELRSQSSPKIDAATTEASPISEDWLNSFESEAAKMGSEQMQLLFGKILAGEIRRPKSYSIKAIKLMSELDNQAALLFKVACSLSVSLRIEKNGLILDARVLSLGGNAAANSLIAYGLNFDALNTLQEYGLIIPDYNSHMDYRVAIAQDQRVAVPLIYENSRWGLVPKSSETTLFSSPFSLHGVALSKVGKELLSIVNLEPNEQYSRDLRNFFEKLGMQLTPIE